MDNNEDSSEAKDTFFAENEIFLKEESLFAKEEILRDEDAFHKALDELFRVNVKAYQFYSKSVGRKKMFNFRLHHDTKLCQNLQTNFFSNSTYKTSLAKLHVNFPFVSSFPVPINRSTEHPESDAALKSKIDKIKWKNTVSTMVSHIKNAGMQYSQITNKEDICAMPKYMADFVELLDSDPDEFQDSSYDWYFSGRGTLQHFNLGGMSYFIQGVRNKICITPYSWENNEIILDESNCHYFICSEKLYVTEICTYRIDDCKVLAAARTRRITHIFTMSSSNDTNKLSINHCRVFNSPIPSTSVAFLDGTTAICSYLDNTIQLKDIAYEKDTIIKLQDENDSKLNNWQSAAAINENNFLVCGRERVYMIDRRSGDARTSVALEDVTDFCENFTLLHKSPFKESCFYFGTYHRLFAGDVRFRPSGRCRMMQRWTHAMETAPLFACSASLDDGRNEIVCLANQVDSDMRFIVDAYTQLHLDANIAPDSSVMPWAPHRLFDSLRYAQIRGSCLDPNSQIKRRLNMSVTGVTLLDNCANASDINVIFQNSCGDLFQNRLLPKSHSNNEDISASLESWGEHLRLSKPARKIFVSSKESMGPYIFNRFKKNYKNYVPGESSQGENLNDDSPKNFLGEFNVTRSIEKEILSAWNIDID